MKINVPPKDSAGKPGSKTQPINIAAAAELTSDKREERDDEEPEPEKEEDDDDSQLPMDPRALRSLRDDEITDAWVAVEKTPLNGVISRSKWEAMERFARFLEVKLSPSLVGINLIEASELIQQSMRVANNIAGSQKSSVGAKISAVEAVTVAAKAQVDIARQIVKLYKPIRREDAVVSAGKNQGPSTDGPLILAQNVQINSGGKANSGTRPAID